MLRTALKLVPTRKRRADTRVLTGVQWQALMADPMAGGAPHMGGDRRTQVRLRHREVLHLFLGLGCLREPRERYLVHTRDISRHGVGLVHGGEVRRGERCRVGLLTEDRRRLDRTGAVATCAPRADGLYNVGLVLDAELPLRDLARKAVRAMG